MSFYKIQNPKEEHKESINLNIGSQHINKDNTDFNQVSSQMFEVQSTYSQLTELSAQRVKEVDNI